MNNINKFVSFIKNKMEKIKEKVLTTPEVVVPEIVTEDGPEPLVESQRISRSPEPQEVIYEEFEQMNFYEAVREIVKGKKVTKIEWGGSDFYGVLDNSILKIHKDDGKLYHWIISEADILGEDYVIVK
jgi:hypothetical protein